MGILNFLKKNAEEQFEEAVSNRDYERVVSLGKELLKKYPESAQLTMSYADALVKIGKKEEAVDVLLRFAEKKLKEDYFETAILILKKALKVDPFNVRIIRLLATAYQRKELYYEAFDTLTGAFRKFKESGKDISQIKKAIDDFLNETFRFVSSEKRSDVPQVPGSELVWGFYRSLFYEMYGDLLREFGLKEEAAVNYVRAGSIYVNLRNYESALKAFQKAKEVGTGPNICKQIVEVISRVPDDFPEMDRLLASIIEEFKADFNFIQFTVSRFKDSDKLPYLKKVVEKYVSPSVRDVYLILINRGQETEKRPPEALKEELPEPEEVLNLLDKAIESKEGGKTDSSSSQREVRKILSMAEAMIGLGRYRDAEGMARKVIGTEEGGKAVLLVAEAMMLQGREKDATAFLLENLKKDFPAEEKARFEVKLGEIYRQMGDRERALYWLKTAQKILKDPNIQEEIKNLESQSV